MPAGSHFVRSRGVYLSLCSVVTDGGRGMMLEDEGKHGKKQTCWRRADMKERCISSLPNEVLMLGGGVTKTRESGGREKYLSPSY